MTCLLLVAAASGAGACGYEMQTDGGWLPVTVGWSGQGAGMQWAWSWGVAVAGVIAAGLSDARVVGRWLSVVMF